MVIISICRVKKYHHICNMNINRWRKWSTFIQEEIQIACIPFTLIRMSAFLMNRVESKPDIRLSPPLGW